MAVVNPEVTLVSTEHTTVLLYLKMHLFLFQTYPMVLEYRPRIDFG